MVCIVFLGQFLGTPTTRLILQPSPFATLRLNADRHITSPMTVRTVGASMGVSRGEGRGEKFLVTPMGARRKPGSHTYGNAAATQSQTRAVTINCCSLTDAAAAAKTTKKLDTTVAQNRSRPIYYQSLFAVFVVSLGVLTK